VPEQRGGSSSGGQGTGALTAQSSAAQAHLEGQIDTLLHGRNADPFAVLGPQPVEIASGRRWVIRFYNPGAVSATVKVNGIAAPIEAKKRRNEGVFEATLPETYKDRPEPANYRIRFATDSGHTWEFVPRHCRIKEAIVKRMAAIILIGTAWMFNGMTASAQTTPSQEATPHAISNQELDLLRKDLRSQRKQLIAANLKLTDTEATKFWPLYDQYVSELITINDKKFGLIQEYADNFGKLTSEQSLSFIRRWLDADIATAQLRQKYVPIVSNVLDGRKSATFFQLDRRIAMMIELQVSTQMPLVQTQTQ
jgi:hypothetical protein